jgi:hypothetical protein
MKHLIPLMLLPLASVAPAGDGHDHGDAPAAPAGQALPRFAAVSDSFELVGVLDGKQITLYLDRAADNSPVADAQIELDLGGAKHKARKHGADEYQVMLAAAPKPGVLAVTVTVVAGAETDLLAGELDLHGAAQAPHQAAQARWLAWAAGAAALLGVLVVLGLVARRLGAQR